MMNMNMNVNVNSKAPTATKVPVHCEVALRAGAGAGGVIRLDREEMKNVILDYLSQICPVFKNGVLRSSIPTLEFVESIQVCDLNENQSVSFWQAQVLIYIFLLNDTLPEKDYLDGIEGGEEGGGTTTAYEQWELPNKHLYGLWESIVIEKVYIYIYTCTYSYIHILTHIKIYVYI